jgi:hypothetical protein
MQSLMRTTSGSLAVRIGALAAALVFAFAGFARAETITATLESISPYAGGTMSLDGDLYYGAIAEIIYQGVSTNPAPFNGMFTTYCIDLNEPVFLGVTYTFTLTPIEDAPKAAAYPDGGDTTGMGPGKAEEIEELYGQEYANTLGPGDDEEREAFQLAIWNIIYDTDTSVSDGDGVLFAEDDVDPIAVAIANTWLEDAANPQLEAIFHDTNLVGLTGDQGVQDQITTSIPVEPSVFGGGMLMAGLGLMRVQKRRRSKASSF